MNLMCEPDWKIGFLGSSYFFGWVLSLLWMPRLGDFYGRKRPFAATMVVDTVLYTALLFTKKIDMAILIIFLAGFFTSLRLGVGFLYLMELLPSKARVAIGSAWCVSESSIMLFATLYFMLSKGRKWIYFGIYGYLT